MRKRYDASAVGRLQVEGSTMFSGAASLPSGLALAAATRPPLTRLFDQACDALHYAGACRRVGRKLRLAIVVDGEWAGGIVLGSPFPNIQPRDDLLGLSQFVAGWQARGLRGPWARENTPYWSRLQLIVNHARTFVFPRHQGAAVATEAHRLLLGPGLDHWRERYQTEVIALDTLCTHPASRLFLENGWQLVGRTKGYTRDPSQVLSKHAFDSDWAAIRENAGLRRLEGSDRWWIWVRPL